MPQMTCIGCPIGCTLTVNIREKEIEVQGNNCPRGEKYARDEITCPKRTLTSTVALTGGSIPRLSVKTETDIPKERIMDCMAEIRRVTATAPVCIGDVVLHNCANTGVNVIATKNISAVLQGEESR